jgi:hypothetical protein
VNDATNKLVECPICGKHNNCGNHSCWCSKEVFPSGIFDLVPVNQLRKSCICKECLDKFKESQK